MGPFVVYTAGRIAIFGALLGLLWLVGLDGLVLALVAVTLSLPVSYVLLARPRAALGQRIERRVGERRSRRADLRSRLRGEDPAADGPDGDQPGSR